MTELKTYVASLYIIFLVIGVTFFLLTAYQELCFFIPAFLFLIFDISSVFSSKGINS